MKSDQSPSWILRGCAGTLMVVAIAVLVAAARNNHPIGFASTRFRYNGGSDHGVDDLQPLDPVAKRFAKPRAPRSIGAISSEDSASYFASHRKTHSM